MQLQNYCLDSASGQLEGAIPRLNEDDLLLIDNQVYSLFQLEITEVKINY